MSGRDIFSFKLSTPCIPFLVDESISNLKTKTLDLVEWFVYNSCDKRQRENGLETAQKILNSIGTELIWFGLCLIQVCTTTDPREFFSFHSMYLILYTWLGCRKTCWLMCRGWTAGHERSSLPQAQFHPSESRSLMHLAFATGNLRSQATKKGQGHGLVLGLQL